MNKPLIVGVDGSDSSLRAIDWAVAEAARFDLPLRLVYGSMWERYEEVTPDFRTKASAGHVMAEGIVGQAADRVAKIAPALAVSTFLGPAEPGLALLREGENATAIVVGTRGRGTITGMLLGSTSLQVAAYATCPVVVVRGEASNIRGDFSRVTLGVGGAESAAVEFAFRAAQAREAELHAVHAWHRLAGIRHGSGDDSEHGAQDAERVLDTALPAAAQDFPKVTVRRETPEGRAHHVLLDASARSDLVVVGGRRGPRAGWQLGMVNHAVLHHSACPVAVVPYE